MNDLFQAAYDQLFSWCREHDFAGHDPFDALNSRLFQSTPLAQSRNARFIWTQLVKRSPSDFRGLARVPAERNAKGIALFALAQIANYRRLKTEESEKLVHSFLVRTAGNETRWLQRSGVGIQLRLAKSQLLRTDEVRRRSFQQPLRLAR